MQPGRKTPHVTFGSAADILLVDPPVVTAPRLHNAGFIRRMELFTHEKQRGTIRIANLIFTRPEVNIVADCIRTGCPAKIGSGIDIGGKVCRIGTGRLARQWRRRAGRHQKHRRIVRFAAVVFQTAGLLRSL